MVRFITGITVVFFFTFFCEGVVIICTLTRLHGGEVSGVPLIIRGLPDSHKTFVLDGIWGPPYY